MRTMRGILLGLLLLAGTLAAQVKLESAEALAFGPGGVLFVGDSAAGAVVAIETGDVTPGPAAERLAVDGIDQTLAAAFGLKRTDIRFTDVKVNPISKAIYLSMAKGRGPEALPAIVRVDASGAWRELEVSVLKSTKVDLPGLPSEPGGRRRTSRTQLITELQYTDGKVIVAGLSNQDFSSTLRVVPFPFGKADRGASVEIFHTAHFAYETNAPVRSMVPYTAGGEKYLLAVYTCTPLVRLKMSDLVDGAHVIGDSLAELGRHSSPLDMIQYSRGGEDFLLVANTLHGIEKLSLRNIDKYEAVTEDGGDEYQVPMEKIRHLKGIVQMDGYDANRAVVLIEEKTKFDLRMISLP
jgi:hypothetical protein